MTRFAESVGCALIAEGIETENELTTLKLLKVEYGQGYYLARPAPIATWVTSPTPAEQAVPNAGKARKPRRRSVAA